MSGKMASRKTRSRKNDEHAEVPVKMRKMEQELVLAESEPKNQAKRGRGRPPKKVLGSQKVVNTLEKNSDEDDNENEKNEVKKVDVNSEGKELEELEEPTDPERGMKMYMQLLDKTYFNRKEENQLPPMIQDYLKLTNVNFQSVRINGKDFPKATIELLGMLVRKSQVLSIPLEKTRIDGRIQARANEEMMAKLSYLCAKLKCPSLTFQHLEEAEHLLHHELEKNHPILKLVEVAKQELEWIRRPGNSSFHTLTPKEKEEPMWELSEKLYNEMVKDDSNFDYECKIFLIWALQNHSATNAIHC